MLPAGSIDFNKMNDVFVIMIMPFDLFGEGLYKYTFRMTSEEAPHLELGDGITTMFLNTKGTKPEGVSQEFIDLLKYFEETTEEAAKRSKSKKIQRISSIIEDIRRNEDVGVKFMQAWEEKILDKQEAREEGLAEGRAEGIAEGIARANTETALRMKESGFEYQVIADMTKLSIEEIEKL